MKAKKHTLQVGDPVFVLWCQHLRPGTVVKINRKTIKVDFPACAWRAEQKNCAPERVAHRDDILTVVWDMRRGVEGAYRLDYDTYPQHNKPIREWHAPYTYVTED